ncbi:hypothetical protein, partial [Yersinia frederiksenii]|uniref:hypothetical protein n=1 Tax=Yersinia frederiksenii TaxID=29484 RepID=UPI0025AEA9B3
MIVIWGWIYLPGVFSKAYMPDEGWFLKIALDSFVQHGISLDSTLFHKNDLGYASLWWGLYVTVIWISSLIWPSADMISANNSSTWDFRLELFDVIDKNYALLNSINIMRAISISVFLLFSLMMLRQVFKKSENILGILILLSTPMVYWSGKIASSELIGVYLVLISVIGYIKHNNIKWIFLSGVGLAVKMTCFPVCAAFLLYVLYVRRSW